MPPFLFKNSRGNVVWTKNKHVRGGVMKQGGAMIALDPIEHRINRIGGLPTLGHSLISNLPIPVPKEINNYKVTPKVLVAERRVLNGISAPVKKMNNLRFEL